VWGTAVARNKWLEHAGISGGGKWPSIPHPAFRAFSSRRHDRGLHMVELEIKTPGIYEGQEFLHYHLFGKAPVITLPGPAKQHVYTFDDATVLPAGLTIEVAHRNNAAVEEYLYEGCKVAGVTVECNLDRTLDLAWKLYGRREQPGTYTTPTYPAENPIYWSHMQVQKGGVAFDVRSATVNIDTGLSKDERRAIGSLFPKEFIRIAKRTITGTITLDFEDATTLRNLLLGTGTSPAETAFRLNIVCTHPNANAIEAGHTYVWNLELPVCYVESSELPVGDVGIVSNEIAFFAEYDDAGAAEIAKLTTKNSVTAVP
jgi:hypothetical protein